MTCVCCSVVGGAGGGRERPQPEGEQRQSEAEPVVSERSVIGGGQKGACQGNA